MARGRGGNKKNGSKPTSDARSKKQALRDRYAHAREDAQLAGLIPTKPEEALKPEVVDPATQTEAPQVGLIVQALRSGWAVPEGRKPDLVDELMRILDDPEMCAKVKVSAFNALRMADQQQYERDHPEQMAKLRGSAGTGTVNVNNTNVQNNVTVGELFSDIKTIEESYARVVGSAPRDSTPAHVERSGDESQANSEAASGVRADSDAQPVDEEEPNSSEEEPEAN